MNLISMGKSSCIPTREGGDLSTVNSAAALSEVKASDTTMEENTTKTECCWALITTKERCHKLRTALVSSGLFDSSKPVQHFKDSTMALAVCYPSNETLSMEELLQSVKCSDARTLIESLAQDLRQIQFSTNPVRATQRTKLLSALKTFVLQKGQEWSCELQATVPRNWEKHGDLIILPQNSFQQELWQKFVGEDLWLTVMKALSVNRLACKNPVHNDDFRSSQIQLLHGNDGWVTHIDNGIKYAFDVTKSMFCSGNITEKLRIASFNCREQIVVDMFAGIGYFVLPYLIHAKAKLVHACEWNPVAVQALLHNLKLNNVSDRCIIHYGDNRNVTPVGVAQRVNLGLIPSSESSWGAACKALDPQTGGVLHIHGNVSSRDHQMIAESSHIAAWTQSRKSLKVQWINWAFEVSLKISDILHQVSDVHWTVRVQHIEHVKCYAPHIDHMVVDLECLPPSISFLDKY